jgi:Protein kinase domain.
MIIPNYEITEKIAESHQAAIFKAYHKKKPDRLLVLKILKTAFLSEYKKTEFKQKIEHLRVLNDPLIITPIEFSEKNETFFITYDYFDGVPLNKLTDHSPDINLDVFFSP